MANETTWRLNFENEDMESVFKSLIDKIEQTDKELRSLEKTQKDTFDAMANNSSTVNDNLKSQSKQLDINKVGFKDLKEKGQDALEGIAGSSGSATSSIAKLGRAGGIVGTIIAGVGAAVVAAFLDVEENANAAKVKLEGLRAVGNELKTRTFAGLRGLVKAISGDFGGAALEFKKAAGDIGDALNNANKAGKDLESLRQSIGQANKGLLKIESSLNVELQKKQLLAADESKTTAERIGLVRSAAAIEGEINDNRIIQLTNQLALLQREADLYGNQKGSIDAIASVEAELTELRGASQVINIQSQQEINALLGEEAKLRQKIIGQIKDANAIFTDQQAERSLEKQIQSFKDLRDSIVSAGLAEEYSSELSELDRVIDGLGNRLADGLQKPLEKLPVALSGAAKEVFSDTSLNLDDRLLIDAQNAIEKVQAGIKEQSVSFFKGLTDDQKQFIEDQFKDAFSSVADIVVQSTLAQIDRQEQVVDAREDNISALESQLAEQERLEAQGLANQSSRLRQSLQEERTILKREQDRRIELEKKAARQRLITNSLQQASELTLAASKIIKEGSGGFIPGLIAAAGGIALIFRIIAQAKANAAAFATPPKFREGTNYLVGPSHEGGGISIEAEGGERILSKALNDRLGGSQLSNDELANFALMGMNAEQAIGPMAAAIASGAASSRKVEDFKAWERNEIIADVFKVEMRSMKKELIDTMRERPTYYPTDQPGRREYYKGKTKVVEKIIPNNQP